MINQGVPSKKTVGCVNEFIINCSHYLNQYSQYSDQQLNKLEQFLDMQENLIQQLSTKLSLIEGDELDDQSSSNQLSQSEKSDSFDENINNKSQNDNDKKEEEEENNAENKDQVPEHLQKFVYMLKIGIPAQAVKIKMQSLDQNPQELDKYIPDQ